MDNDADNTVLVTLTKGYRAIIDREDLELVTTFSWRANTKNGSSVYARAHDDRLGKKNRKNIWMHRLILAAPTGTIVDHIDGNGLNNRRSNLRIATYAQNAHNRRVKRGRWLRGTKPKGPRWEASITFGGVQRFLGHYDTEIEAHAAYLAEARRLYGEFVPDVMPAPMHCG